jgi:hypothetical protein
VTKRGWRGLAVACAVLVMRSEPAVAQPPPDANAPTPISVSGRVVDAHGKPLREARITVEGTSLAATTDREGRYHLEGVTPGATIVIDHEGFQTGVATATEETVPDVVLLTIAQSTETIEVHGEPPPAAPGATSIGRDDVQRVPGTGGEITRALGAMPGVVNRQLPTSPAGIVIRGSAPQDSKILVDDFEIPLLYHFVAFRAILPTEAIDKLEYIPGGFDVAYGRAGSGIVALTTRAGSEHRSEQAELSVLDGGALAQGSAGKDTTYMFAFRRSTIDLVLPEVIPSTANVSLLTYPLYYDLQARVDHTLNAHWKLTLSSIGADDVFSLFRDKMQNADKRFYAQTEFLRTTATARYHDGPWNLVLALSEMPQRFEFDLGAAQSLHIDRLDTDARGELSRSFAELAGLRDVVWRVGAEAAVSRYSLDIAAPAPPQSGIRMGIGAGENQNPNDVSTKFDGIVWTPDFAGWTALTASLDPRIRVTTALRIDGFGRSGDTAVEPRGDLQIKLAEKLTARLAAGAYRRPPEYQEELLHSELHPERDTQVIAGVEDEPYPGVRVQASIYYTDRTHLIVTDARGQFANTGRGTTYGAELLATLREDPWFAWLSYSYSHSTRVDEPGAETRLFEFDQPHSLNAAASWKRGAWQLGARFEYYSGLPYTPVIGSVFNSDINYYTPIYGNIDSERAPAHHQLDLRVDRIWQLGSLALTGFIDVQNVYLNRSVTSYGYNYDFSQRFAFQSLPIIPTIGIRGVL